MVKLANRRFLPLFFDLATSGAAGDADARGFVVKARPEMGGTGVAPPNVLFMDPDGKVLGEAGNFAPPDDFYASMREVLKRHPEFDAAGEDERKAGTDLARACIQAELGNLEAAEKLAASDRSDAAAYLCGHWARLRGDWEAMERAFGRIAGKDLDDDVRLERAHRLWQERKFAALADRLKGFPAESPRCAEARYYEGLAAFHLGKKEDALAIWRSAFSKDRSQDGWSYRIDWAYTNVAGGSQMMITDARKGASLLGRIGYLGENPDLLGKLEQAPMPYIGVRLAEEGPEEAGKGVLLGGVEKDGPASKAGLAAGDRVLSVNGKPVADGGDLALHVRASEIGSVLEIVRVRDGEERLVRVTVAARPR